MAKNKTIKEHYIPRAAYLRRFSDTRSNKDKKNKLIAYSKEKDCYRVTNVYDDGMVKNLYEAEGLPENSVEKLLFAIETDLGPIFDKMERICTDPANANCLVLCDGNERDNLKFFVVLQYFRTEKRKRQFQEETGDKRAGELKFFSKLIGKTSDGKAVLLEYKELLKDLYFVFEWNKTICPFVLPDDPVTLFHSELDAEETINFRFPLSPWLHILLIDPNSSDHESIRKYRNRIRIIEEEAYIRLWNKRSVDAAFRHVYFPPGYEETVGLIDTKHNVVE